MSASLARLRKRAAEFEQKKQFDRALEVYVQILDEGGKDLHDEDVPLFNRVGDMLMRKGSVTEALGYYERAVDVYAERGYLNNAIALCSKILRQSPGRAAVYYKLARISARKGFKSDARKNFLEYADRMQKLGMADEAFRALKEFASLYPDQDDVRLVLAELLSKENRKGEALEQLQSLYEKLQSEGRAAEARATIDRMRAIDPTVTPREGAPIQSAAAGDLVFLDLTDAESSSTPGSASPQPTSARAPIPSPVPALDGLSITFFPDETGAPHPEGFESTAVETESVDVPPAERSLTPLGTELVVEPSAPDEPLDVPPIELLPERDVAQVPAPEADRAPASLERVEDLIDDLLPEPALESRYLTPRSVTPLSSFQFADVALDEVPHESPHREHDLALPGELAPADEDTPATPMPSLDSAAAADDARAAAEEAADLAADVAAREAAHARPPADLRPAAPLITPSPDESIASIDVAPDEANDSLANPAPVSPAAVPDDFLALPPSFGSSSSTSAEYAFPPLPGLDDTPLLADEPSDAQTEPEPAAESAMPAVQSTVSIGGPESHLRSRLEIDPENWDLRRQLGEVLLDAGERDDGLYELELAIAGYELKGDLSRAQEVVDEILRVAPGSVSHHQKRVEYAVKSRDRQRLTDSYLELADALFRNGSADKAVAVYSRVLEHDASNERAEFALATLAPERLEKLRGLPARPERWSDELAAIGGNTPASQSAQRAAQNPDVLPDESTAEGSDASVPEALPDPSPRVRFDSIELPVPDWGEGVPRAKAANTSPPVPQVEPPEAAPADANLQRVSADSAAEEPESQPEQVVGASEKRDDHESPGDLETRIDDWREEPLASVPSDTTPSANHEITDRAEVVPGFVTPESTPSATRGFSRPTPISISSTGNGLPHATRHTSAPRGVTPIPVPAINSESPLAGSESDFVDLGEWLRNTEPPRSTRMQVEDPKPTGDEQADFEEMLRRFKRGVAANVEAEDYDAHYDLGVAYKEMGLVDEAIAQFQKALRGVEHRVRSYEALGQCFVEKQQFAIAAALLQRATEVPGSDDQQLVGVLYLLGFAKEQMGHPEEALPYYLRVFAVDIEFRDVAERVAALGNANK